MQLLKLQMRNFRRYRHQDVVFRDGITGILGNNGTGKSTIVEAILFCLYGVKETGLEYILSATAGPRDRAEVRLDFSVRGDEFQIVRSLGPRKKHEAQLNRGGVLLAKGVSEVHEALRGVIRMGQADFRHTIFSGQKELLALLDATPEGRKQWFRKVLGIDSLKDRGGEILRVEAAAARDELLRIEGRLADTDARGIQRAIEEAGQGITVHDREIGDLIDRERALGTARASLEEEMGGHREREKKDHALRSLIEVKEKEAAGLEGNLAETRRLLAALDGTRQEYEDLAGRETGFLAIHERYMMSTGRSRTFQELTARISEKEGQIAEGEGELACLQDEDARLRRDGEMVLILAPAVARREEILGRLAGLRSLEERSRTIAAGIERKAATLEELAGRGGILLARIERMREAKARLGEVARRAGIPGEPAAGLVPALEARRQETQQAIADATSERDHAARRIGELKEVLSTMAAAGADGTCPTCRQPLGDRYRELVAGIEKEAAALRDEIACRERDLRKAAEYLVSIRSLLDEAQGLREACSQLEEALADWTAIQDQTRREISSKEQLEEEAASLGYDPAVRAALEEEVAGLEVPWRDNLAASERLKARPELARRMRKTGEAVEKFRKEAAGIAREKDGLGFDPRLHRLIEEEYREAEQAHRRYLELKPGMERVPVLLGLEKDLLARAGSASQALEGLRSELAGIGFSREELRREESRLEENSRKALELGRCLERARAGKSRLEGERTRLAEALSRLEKDTGNRDRLREEIALLELTRDQLNGFTDHLLGIVRDQIQEETGRILAEITDGRYDTVILDDTFELLVHDLGGDFPVSRFSGGEQDDVAIALRIALSRYIAEMHELRDSTFLIFDEIFGSQDEERRGNIFRALRALEPYFPQIFLISHVADVQGEFGNTLVVEAVSPSESRIRDLGEGGA
jgi:DNA repair exonuclease SbcCD ATPase subunit